jgi:hypothetical protein
MTDNSEIALPSDPEVRNRIKQAVLEGSAAVQLIEDRKAAYNDIVKMVKDDLGLPKGTFKKMVKAYHKQQYAAIVHENEVFQVMYENIMETNTGE